MSDVHFSQTELTCTNTGLPNEPDGVACANLTRLITDALEPMREIVGPMRVNSGYRSKAVNTAIGGAKNSQHMKGQAADVVPTGMDLEKAFRAVQSSPIQFDQLIREPTWIHISVPDCGARPRRQCLTAHIENGHMVYDGVKNR